MSKFLQLSSFLFCTFLSVSTLKSQNNTNWALKYGYEKAFIENKGQFSYNNNSSDILFAADQGGTKIYFTKKGIIYTFLEVSKKPKDAKEMEREFEREHKFRSEEEHREHEKEEHALKIKTDAVNMLFLNANPNVQIQASEATTDYHNYALKTSGNMNSISNIKGYKKITYKNIYPNIDIVYTFSEKGGLKYDIILHPGANPSLIKMNYDNSVSIKSNGDLHIDTKFGDMIDHAPSSFYQNNSSSIIKSKFVKTGKTISVELDNYDNTQTVIIDPWVQTPAYTSNWDCVWECERDGAGNVYIIGGVTPLQLKKFNSAGVIQWTYNTAYDTTSWLGTFAVDNAGNSYVTNGTTPGIIKVNTAGVLQWTTGGGALAEYWNIAFNCDQTKLIVGGTDNLRGAIFDINTANGAVLATKIVAYGTAFGFPPSIQEVRSITPSGNGRYYFLTLDSIGYINQNFTLCGSNSAIFKTTSTHTFSYKCENFRYDNSGIMAIRADLNFVYTHNGTTLFKRSLINASIIASVAIPGGAATTSLGQKAVNCSGIDIDASGNIYVGSTNAVTKFSPALVQLGTVAVPFNVYDVHVSTAGDVIACGSTGNSSTASRTGYIQSISSLTAANTLSLICCDANICPPPNLCSNAAAITMTAASAGGTWSGTGITNATTGVFNPATAGVGTHTITYTLPCGFSTQTVNVISCGTMSVCNNSGTLTVTGGTGPYSWASTSTSISCASCPGGNCIPFVCAGTSVPTWTASGSSVTAPSAGTFPVKLTDGASAVTITLTTLAGIPSCSPTTCPTLALSVSSQTNVNCFGASTGSATINSTGGVAPYSYTWSPSGGNSASATGLAAGVYTVAVKDANLCPGTITVTITQPASALVANITATTQATCGQSNASATVTASGGTAGYTYSWSPTGGTASTTNTLGVGGATVLVTDSKGCTQTAITTITSASGPTLSVVSQTNVNCFGATTGSATVNSIGGTGPYTYTWNPGNLSGASQTNLAAGIYTVTTSDAGGCSGTGTVSITQPTSSLSIITNSTTPATCGQTNGSATITASGGTPGYTYTWSPTGGNAATTNSLSAGNSSITITDSKGCLQTVVISISTASGPTLSVVSQTNVNCFGAATGSATVSSTGGTGPYTYTWNPGNLSGASQTNLAAGIYTVSTSDAGGCVGSGTVSITQPTASLSIAINATTAATCGQTNGSATITASGGTPGYTYTWSPSGGNAATTSSLAAGSSSIAITDSKGCLFTLPVNITSASGPTLSVVSQTNVNCFGASTGSATVSSTGGTGPYTYTWNPGNLSGASQTNLAAGIYTVSTSDAGGCVGSGTVSITQPTASLSIAINATTTASCGQTNGSATITASGGTPGYTYTWSPSGGNAATTSSLAAGSSSIAITDSKGCLFTLPVNITSASGPTLSIASQTNVNCFGASTGSATVNVTGGVGPHTFTWTPGNLSGGIQTNLAAGIYTIIVKDVNGCTGSNTLTITQPTSALVASPITTSSTTCGGSTGSATVTASGGTPGYTYVWSPTGGSSNIATGLSAQNYTVTITDSKNCTKTATATIANSSGPTVSVVTQSNVTCFGSATGNASVSVSGSGPYTYTWSPSGGNSASATNLAAGVYTVTASSSGCLGSAVITITQTPAINLTLTAVSATCTGANGSASVTASGGNGPYSYLWSNGITTSTVANIAGGNYSVSVTDASNCVRTGTVLVPITNSTFVIHAGTSVVIAPGETTILNGAVPVGSSFLWSPGNSLSCTNCLHPVANPTQTTTYTLTATNANGCIMRDTVTVKVEIPCGELFVPTAFSPNNDGANDILYVYGNCIKDLDFVIFNRWGEKVFETKDAGFGWDGTFKGKPENPAVFAYYIKAMINGEEVIKNGSIVLVK